ncbi:DUF4272 domain-containing protein [Sphingomonas sp.]|uniref:DUF4272 domain-containing protein n=1 Tax=Sphingomonas sp. TaxID=28214 RepID=UPI0025D621B8|nr:DUF4272 domain-containing protein [Sphingomonas sp.]
MAEERIIEEIRSANDVAYRALILFCITGLAAGADRSEITAWLSEHDLWGKLAPSEIGFIDTPSPTHQQLVNASWLSERLVMIVWTLGQLDQLPAPDEQCDLSVFQDVLPPFADVTVPEFVATARLRSPAELIAMADETMGLHWAARDAQINERPREQNVDLEIIQERHHAINWVIGYGALDWDEVTTDT